MSTNTKIEWADHTFNPWVGCVKVSPACDHCYAEGWAKRSGQVVWGGERKRTSVAHWNLPLKWNRAAMAQGIRYRVFCASLGDVFDNQVPSNWRVDLFQLIADTPHLDWLLLTKRIGNAQEMLDDVIDVLSLGVNRWDDAPWPNVWLGATICNQEEADRDIPKLLAVPTAKRFLSMEPLLGPVNLTNVAPPTVEGRVWHGIDAITSANRELRGCIDWVIVGGESGTNARPMHPDWVRSLRDQCQEAGVAFFFKQWGEWWEYANEDHYTHCGAEKHAHAWVDADTGDSGKCWIVDDDGSWSNWTGTPRGLPKGDEDVNGGNMHPSVTVMGRYGKKASGRLLDGRTWDEVPS